MGNIHTSADVVFEYTGDGCSVPKDVTSVRFNNGLQRIGNHAFFRCTSLDNITIPPTLVEIGVYAFEDCSNLREVIFNDGLQKIGSGAFCNCSSIKRITLPSTMSEIGIRAFNSCTNLREVRLNNGLQKVRNGAFCNCSSLESITLPSTVTEIGGSAFNSCTNLRGVRLNNGLQKIGEDAFYNCTSLESITLPSTVTAIGIYAFGGCINLREVELYGIPQHVMNTAFENCGALERFLFPTISFRLQNNIQTSHWEELEDKVNEVRGVVQWESNKLFVSTATYHTNWNETKRDLARITRLISYCELKEATITFELALWKFKLDQEDASNITNRATYRIDVPGPVKDTILQYLDHS